MLLSPVYSEVEVEASMLWALGGGKERSLGSTTSEGGGQKVMEPKVDVWRQRPRIPQARKQDIVPSKCVINHTLLRCSNSFENFLEREARTFGRRLHQTAFIALGVYSSTLAVPVGSRLVSARLSLRLI